ncbi:hypothetical protein PR202_gb08592 [Eleusine coracana subsp. coracana]|uniref:Uncharacterized protein n=1 Tax=Eleusine coracana subsp. coracana TaxID=191504 RepID=A0AAV5EFA0_ELECO|nr:hypothetical protein PR202_gb08592 [Eleusine coracana subsp. coracana]
MDREEDVEEGEHGEEDGGVDVDGDAAGARVAELDQPRPRRDLESSPGESTMNRATAPTNGSQSIISPDRLIDRCTSG